MKKERPDICGMDILQMQCLIGYAVSECIFRLSYIGESIVSSYEHTSIQ